MHDLTYIQLRANGVLQNKVNSNQRQLELKVNVTLSASSDRPSLGWKVSSFEQQYTSPRGVIILQPAAFLNTCRKSLFISTLISESLHS